MLHGRAKSREAAEGRVRDRQGLRRKETGRSGATLSRRKKKDAVWKKRELIRHSTFISCDLRVRTQTMQLNSNCNGFCFTGLPGTAYL